MMSVVHNTVIVAKSASIVGIRSAFEARSDNWVLLRYIIKLYILVRLGKE